jgi:hypothetical protein
MGHWEKEGPYVSQTLGSLSEGRASLFLASGKGCEACLHLIAQASSWEAIVLLPHSPPAPAT